MKKYKVTEDGIEYDVEEYYNGEYYNGEYYNGEYYNGDKYWWLNGKSHRINGPSIEFSDGRKWWYLDGIAYTKKEYHLELLKRNLITEKQSFIELI